MRRKDKKDKMKIIPEKKYNQKTARPYRMKNMVGEKFGYLEVLSLNEEKSTNKHKQWNCKCLRCGENCVKEGSMLRLGKYTCCPKCAIEIRSDGFREKMTGQRYGRLIVDEEYIEQKKVRCTCDCGNVVTLRRGDVLSGHTQSCGCLQSERTSNSNTKDQSGLVSESGIKFIRPVEKVGKGVWVYECECPICGSVFNAIPAKLKSSNVQSCGCAWRTQLSRATVMIGNYLMEHGINYEKEYSFPDCRYKNVLRFDFVIFSNEDVFGVCEYDGAQHFKPVDFFGGEESFIKTRIRDKKKDDYCKKHNIPMLRLNYKMSDDEIISKLKENYIDILV